MHPNTNRALMYVRANELVDMLVTIEPQYRMMISLGYAFSFFLLLLSLTFKDYTLERLRIAMQPAR